MEFLRDLYAARKATPFQPIVRNKDLPPHAVVSFVDEAIHHATPLVGHRQVRLSQLRDFLAADDEFRAIFPLAEAAYLSSSAAGSAQRRAKFRKLLEDVSDQTEQEKWYQLIQLYAGNAPQGPATDSSQKRDEPAVSKPQSKPQSKPESKPESKPQSKPRAKNPLKPKKSNPQRPRKALVEEPDPIADSTPLLRPLDGNIGRHELQMLMSDKQIDRLLATYADDTYRKVSIPAAARHDEKVQGEPLLDESGQQISLTREISQRALQGKLKDPGDQPRRFFRTWVRAVDNGKEADRVS
jgi:hypothetical protein